MTSQSRKQQYFTLIELLVVIAIIAILMSILLPALRNARDTAKLISCASRQKQMGTAVFMYRNESDGWWPIKYHGTAGFPAGYRYVCATYMGCYEKLKGFKVWDTENPLVCPASYSLNEPYVTFWGTTPIGPHDGITSLGQDKVVSSYALNPYFSVDSYAPNARRKEPPRPSLCMLFIEGYRESRPNYWYVSSGQGFVRFRHSETKARASDGRLNMTYTDGHVTNWRYRPTSPIYPVGGNGLWTRQEGFLWWADTLADSKN